MSSFLDSRLRPFGLSFEKTLKDLITGIRSHNSSPEELQLYLNKVIQECKEEVKSTDMTKKSNAVLKLSYLEMYGFDISWSSFYVLEVMSSSSFQQKRVGYLAAQQVFYNDPNILMLATNCLKKDLNSMHTMEVGIALNGISSIITPSLARDISKDLFKMLRHGKSYIRKKAVASLFKLFLQYPEALRDDFQFFMEKLHDEDMSVVSVVVSVICELCKINPEPFMQYLPLFYDMLLDVKNNWITIRLLKLFTTFSKKEPKLRNKLLPKILELISKTDAKSLIYESINCIVKGRMLEADDYEVATQILEPLTTFCESRDPNLRYVSCVLFYHIGKINNVFIERFDSLVFKLLTDVDISIRSRAIELLESVINEDNLVEVTGILLKQVVVNEEKFVSRISGKEERIEILNHYKVKVIDILLYLFQKNDYENISMFEWYITVLSDLANIATSVNLGKDCDLGVKIGEHFRNVAVKVPEMRDQVMVALIKIISIDEIYNEVPVILSDIFWCLGEYSSIISNCDDLIKLLIISKRQLLSNLSADILKNIFPCLMKLFNNWVNSSMSSTAEISSVYELCEQLIEFFDLFTRSSEIEIQERSVEQLEFFKILREALEMCQSNDETQELPMLITNILPLFFNSWEIKPVQRDQQRKLQNMLDLSWLDNEEFLSDAMIKDLEELVDGNAFTDDESDLEEGSFSNETDSSDDEYMKSVKKSLHKADDFDDEELHQRREAQRKERLENPFYLNDDVSNDNLLKEDDVTTKPEDESFEKNTGSIDIRVQHTATKSSKLGKKSKKAKIKVISDSAVDFGEYDLKTKSDSSARASKAPIPTRGASTQRGDTIDLSFQNKFKGFDFNKNGAAVNDQDNAYGEGYGEASQDIDLSKLREQFDAEGKKGEVSDDEEIIVIKKKKKKSSKKDKAANGDEGNGEKKKKKKKAKKVELVDE